MSPQFVRLVVPQDMIEDLVECAGQGGVALSEPQPADATSEPLNAPLAGAEIIAAAQVVTALLTTGTQAVAFASKLAELIKKYRKPVEILNPSDSGVKRRIDDTCSATDITRALSDVQSSSGRS